MFYKVFIVDGVPARMTVQKVPPKGISEVLYVHLVKGTRSYAIALSFATSEHDRFLELADAVCRSIRLLATQKEAQAPPAPTPSSSAGVAGGTGSAPKKTSSGAGATEQRNHGASDGRQ